MIGALKLETDSKIPKYLHQLAFFGVVRQPKLRAGDPAAAAAPAAEVRKPEPAPKK